MFEIQLKVIRTPEIVDVTQNNVSKNERLNKIFLPNTG